MTISAVDDDNAKWLERIRACPQEQLNKMLLDEAGEGRLDRVELLLGAGADINHDNGRALVQAAGGGRLDAARFLVERGIETAACRNEALKIAATPEVARFLIDLGADPRGDDSGALWTAVVNGRAGVAEALLDAGADANAHQKTLLGIALSHRFNAVAESLFRHGADPRDRFRGMNAFEWAVEGNMGALARIMGDAAATDVYMSPGFFRRQTLRELRGFYDERQDLPGLALAAKAGCFDIVCDKIRGSEGDSFRAFDFLESKTGQKNLLEILGAQGSLGQAFDARLWRGRKAEALRVIARIPEEWREQVDAAAFSAEHDRLSLKDAARRLRPPVLKP